MKILIILIIVLHYLVIRSSKAIITGYILKLLHFVINKVNLNNLYVDENFRKFPLHTRKANILTTLQDMTETKLYN